ncbi:MAG: 50S ribosomal protein L29 [Gemmataceae bacterium]|nr:50S ribosomal protein L29 [Gemmataceae bacterium]
MPSKVPEYRGMSDEQLGLSLKDLEKHLFQLRFQSATDRLETPSEIRKAKRDIARVRTLQRERELAKLAALPAEQLATRVASLGAKAEAGGPGKRKVARQLKRVKRLHEAKAGTTTVKGTK